MREGPVDVKVIFAEALEKASPEEQRVYLDQVCGEDAELRAEVERLLDAHNKAGDFLESSPVGQNVTVDVAPSVEGPGTRIGRYELLELIGEGGMGLVYLAEQREPVKRRVALKIIKPGMDSRQVIARFEAERQTLAVLEHPNIAQVFDAGTTETGRPYFVMEYVRGLSITRYCDERKLDVQERLTLFKDVCEGVQHAHQKGIIHRDLKPSNILISVHGDRAVPKIIDFGIAKAVTQPLTDETVFTCQGQLLGTPEYMSPEQVDLAMQDVDTRSDIYSLGVLLYELLAGVLPFDRESFKHLGLADIQRTIREEEPLTPSTRLTGLGEKAKTIAERRRTQLLTLARCLHRELEWIPMKAMRKDRSRRYRSASELADDIQNYLTGVPLIAGPESSVYRARKFMRKHAGSVSMAALVAVAIILGLVASIVMGCRAEQARQQEVCARKQVEQALARAENAERIAQEQREIAEEKAEEYRRSLYRNHIALADVAYRDDNIGRAGKLLEACPEDLRAWEWHRLNYVLDQALITFKASEQYVLDVDLSPDGNTIVSSGTDNTLSLWDTATGIKRKSLHGHETAVTSARFSPDGTRIASGSADKTIKIWDVTTGEELMTLQEEAIITELAFSPDGKHLASSGRLDTVQLWEVATGTKVLTLHGHKDWIYGIAFSPDGKRIVSAGRDKTVGVWDVSTGQQLMVLTGHESSVGGVAVSPDGERIVSVSADKTAKIWDMRTGAELMTLRGHDEKIAAVSFSPDGTQIVTGGNAIKVWSVADGAELASFIGHQRRASGVIFHPDGKRIISSGFDGTIKIWEPGVDPTAPVVLQGQMGPVFSPDGNRLVTSDAEKTVRVWDVATGEEILRVDEAGGNASFSPDGKRIISEDGKNIRVWDARSGAELLKMEGHNSPIWSMSYSPDGKRIVSGGRDKMVRLWDTTTGREIMTLRGHGDWPVDPNFSPVASVRFSPDGQRIASASYDRTVKMWDAATGSEVMTLSHDALVSEVAFSPDGQWVASTNPGIVRVWDVTTGTELLTLRGHRGEVISVAFSPDGKRIVSGGKDDTIKIWDTATGLEITTLVIGDEIWGVSFTPDGETLATASKVYRGARRTVKLWMSTRRTNINNLGTSTDTTASVAN